MSLSQRDADELFGILSRGWDQGALSAEDLAGLEAIIREHGRPACEQLIEFSGMHVELGSILATSRAYRRAMAAVAPDSESDTAPATKAITPKASTSFLQQLIASRWTKWALAAGLLLASAPLWLNTGTAPREALVQAEPAVLFRPPQPIACITIAKDAVWANGDDRGVGSTVKQGQRLELLSGSAQVSMACGVDIVMQGRCAINLVADDLVKLEHGNVTAEAAKWATGFVIETNALRITDLGTRFAMAADPGGVSEVHVLEGKVLAEPMKERRPKRSSMLLKSGEAIRVSLAKATVDLFATQQERFVDRLGKFRPFRPIAMWNTGIGQKVGSDDPHWQVTAGDPKFGPYPKPAVVTPGHPNYLDNAPNASQWISVDGNVEPGIPPTTVHTFEAKFDLSGYDLESVRIVGLFLVDDAINELRINGQPVPFSRWQTTWDVFDFKSFHPIEIRDGFVPGVNVISLDVYNSPTHPDSPPDSPNPMGLRVEWQAFGCEAQ